LKYAQALAVSRISPSSSSVTIEASSPAQAQFSGHEPLQSGMGDSLVDRLSALADRNILNCRAIAGTHKRSVL
jgi:hypothetical protein